MKNITLSDKLQANVTILPNEFIDEYMIPADGEYVKIYLLILRLIGDGYEVSQELLADLLDLTQKDVARAISYWVEAGILTEEPGSGSETIDSPEDMVKAESGPTESGIPTNTIRVVPGKRAFSPIEINEATGDGDLKRTLFMAETYLGKPFSTTELESFCYISNQLGFSPELIEYLIEYCIERDKRSMRYIEKVAIEWYRQGIDSVAAAREQTKAWSSSVYPVLRAFGISQRQPIEAEIEYVRRWRNMGFDTSIITEACSRTVLAINKPSFPYANRILETWHRLGVRTMEDIARIDAEHQSGSAAAAGAGVQGGSGKSPRATAPLPKKGTGSNAFHNFEQRTYDYSQLEAKLRAKIRR